MPTGKVKFFDEEKGFGFIASDEGSQVYLPSSALPAGANPRPGTRVEFSVIEGKRGAQAMGVRIIEAPVSLVKANRKPADEMSIIVEDLIRLLDTIGGGLKRGKYPESAHSRKIAALLRKLADELDD